MTHEVELSQDEIDRIAREMVAELTACVEDLYGSEDAPDASLSINHDWACEYR